MSNWKFTFVATALAFSYMISASADTPPDWHLITHHVKQFETLRIIARKYYGAKPYSVCIQQQIQLPDPNYIRANDVIEFYAPPQHLRLRDVHPEDLHCEKNHVVIGNAGDTPEAPAAVSTAATPEPQESVAPLEARVRFNGSVAVLLGTSSLISADELRLNAPSVNTLDVGVRTSHFWNGNGLRVSWQQKAKDLNGQGKLANPLKLQAHYQHRWFSGSWEWQFLGGFEVYKNWTSLAYSHGYSLISLGANTEVALAQPFHLGGTLLLGSTTRGDLKAELIGYADYKVAAHWALRLENGVEIFMPTAHERSPTGALPYREGAVSVLMSARYLY